MGAKEVSLLLKKLHYHWFWGLYVDERGRDSRFDAYVNELLSDRATRDEAIAAQRRMDSRPLVIRVFYWLFNPSYVFRAYALAACQVVKSEGNDREDAWDAVPFSVGFARQSLMRLCQKTLKSTALVVIASEDVKDVQPLPTTSPSPSFQVTQAMVKHFLVLGIRSQAGDVLLVADFKELARRRRVSTHPDKGGEARLFKKTEAAIKAIKALLESDLNQPNESSLSANDATMESRLDALEREIAEYIALCVRERAEDRAARERERAEDRAARERERAEDRARFEALAAEFVLLRARVDAMLGAQTAASATGVAPAVAAAATLAPSTLAGGAVTGLLSMGLLRPVAVAGAALAITGADKQTDVGFVEESTSPMAINPVW